MPLKANLNEALSAGLKEHHERVESMIPCAGGFEPIVERNPENEDSGKPDYCICLRAVAFKL
jgi:hypothetical protein